MTTFLPVHLWDLFLLSFRHLPLVLSVEHFMCTLFLQANKAESSIYILKYQQEQVFSILKYKWDKGGLKGQAVLTLHVADTYLASHTHP